MYLPKHFSSTDQKKIKNLIEKNSFVTVLSYPGGSNPFINHLPVIFEDPSSETNSYLIGHMAKRNPQWAHFKENPAATIIVQGPHTYITPKWYKSGRDVPTWNYAVAHIQGTIELIEDFHLQVEVLKKLTNFFEGTEPEAWEFGLPDDLLDKTALTSAIISFRFKIESIDAKFKLSQNRSSEDKNGIIEGLSSRKDDMSRWIKELMNES